MKRILISAGTLVFVGALVASATGAFFSDTETSTGNTFAAGAIDLTVDSQAHYDGLFCDDGLWVEEGDTSRPELVGQSCSGTWAMTDLGPTNTFFNLGDLKPGDDGENTISLHVANNDAYACAVVNNLVDDDNGLTEPEGDAGDVTAGPVGGGELSSELHFFAWADNGLGDGVAGDNVWNGAEPALFSNTEGPASDVLGGKSYALFTPQTTAMSAGDTEYIGLYWCYGDITVNEGDHTLACSGASTTNLTQTDSMSADISFYVEQARNNSDFTCPDPDQLNPDVNGEVVTQDDLFTDSTSHATGAGSKWFFYHDTNDTSMSIDQFAANAGANHMATTAGVEGALMTLHDAGGPADPRYNIATYQFAGTALNAITALKYRVYDATADSDKPFLNFNVDFDNSNVWQKRLVYVPGASTNPDLSANTWTIVDALQGGSGMWTWSGYAANGNKWPDNNTNEYRTWNDIKTAFPSAKILASDPWFGVRVGEPGPNGASATVDWIQFNGDTYDFKL